MSDQATLKQGARVLKLLEESGLNRQAIQKLIESGYLSSLLRATKSGTLYSIEIKEFKKFLGLLPLEEVYSNTFKFVVDYGKNYDQMFGGLYPIIDNGVRGVERNYTKKLLKNRTKQYGWGQRVVNAMLVGFDRKFFIMDEAKRAVSGYRPAHIEELLAFGTTQGFGSETQIVAPYVALRNIDSLGAHVGPLAHFLRYEGDRRMLTLGCFEDGFDRSLLFLYIKEDVAEEKNK